jgi:predicted NBD/HSP70 family sugar kinase
MDLAKKYPEKFENIKIALLKDCKCIKKMEIKLPEKDTVIGYDLIGKYLATIIQNMLAIFGADQVLLEANEELVGKVKDHIGRIDPEGKKSSFQHYLTQVYGKFSIGQVEPGIIDELKEYEVHNVDKIDPKNIKNIYIGIDMGATGIKVALVNWRNGKRNYRFKDYNYEFDIDGKHFDKSMDYEKAYHFVRKIKEVLEDFIKENGVDLGEIKGIGISWAGAVGEDGIIVGRAKIVKGLNNKEFELLKEIGKSVASCFGKPVAVLNDGIAGAFWAGSEMDINDSLVLGIGTSLAGGYLDKEGKFPFYLLELAKATVDMSKNAYHHGSTNLQGVLQQYLSLKGGGGRWVEK